MNLYAFIYYKVLGWKATDTFPARRKCIICVAPHTSNWDFIMGELYYRAICRHAGFFMKKDWFFWPLGPILRRMGGIPVQRDRKTSMTDAVAEVARRADDFVVAITPEGTRSRVSEWKRGFYYIALKANLPIQCYALDYKNKQIVGTLELQPTGDVEADLRRIMDYFRPYEGKYPEKFCVEEL